MNRQLVVIVAVLGVSGVMFCMLIACAGVVWLYVDAGQSLINPTTEAPRTIRLPESELSRPPEADDSGKTIVVTIRTGDRVTVGDHEGKLSELASLLREQLNDAGESSLDDYCVRLEAESTTRTGTVQDAIRTCQDVGLKTFEIRAIGDDAR